MSDAIEPPSKFPISAFSKMDKNSPKWPKIGLQISMISMKNFSDKITFIVLIVNFYVF